MKLYHCTHCRAKFWHQDAADSHITMFESTETPHYSYRSYA